MSEAEGAILLAHGAGGLLSRQLVTELFARHLQNPVLDEMGDSAVLAWDAPGSCLAFTTDAYVISPIEFPGGDIGRLAVCGTVNDLAVAGARPRYLSAGFILEEGLPLATLERVVRSMARTAREAGVQVVTGDTKVVGRRAADGLYITTSGVGVVPPGRSLGPRGIRPGDHLLVSGTVGDHGLAVMLRREGFAIESDLQSDCAPLGGLVEALLAACPPGAVRALRDPTRGGLAVTLNEWAQSARVGIEVAAEAIPVREAVRAACELLGLDPLYAANEGKVVVAVAAEAAATALEALRAHPLGAGATDIGIVREEHPGRVVLSTPYGARRLLDMPAGELLPRIC